MKESIITWIKSFYLHRSNGVEIFDQKNYEAHSIYWSLAMLVVFSVICFLLWWFSRHVLIRVLSFLVDRTQISWDDHLVKHKVFRAAAHLVPLMFMENFLATIFYQYPKMQGYWGKFVWIWIIIALIFVINRTLSALREIIQENPRFSDKPIQSYVQVVKIISTLILVVTMFSVLFDKSLWYFLGGLGAFAAVLVLIFRDTILGFVGSVQIATNDMIRIGDWVTMEKYGADGEVEGISLATVKIRNFDRTITTIPTYAFISDSFKNWRGMKESDGRRIKRAVQIQIHSVKFASPELLSDLKAIAILRQFIIDRENEIQQYNESHGFVGENAINGRRQTNLGIFRSYIEHYLRNHPRIHQEMPLMVRQLDSTEVGLPMEIYCFSKEKEWEAYESVQADIFDHIFAMVHLFELDVFERPSGKDFRD